MLGRSKSLKRYRELLFAYERKMFGKMSDADLAEHVTGYVDDIREVNEGDFFSTSFALETQKRIAGDMWRHVLSAKAKESYFILFNHGYNRLMYRIKATSGERALFEYEQIMYSAMEKLIDTSVNKGKLIIQGLVNYPIGKPYAMEGSNLFRKASSEIAHEMFGILLVLPYFEMLKKATDRSVFKKSNDGPNPPQKPLKPELTLLINK